MSQATKLIGEAEELPNQLSAVDQRAAQELRQRNNNLWRSNYHEASIYIEEGLNNDKFENHPKKRRRKALAMGQVPASAPIAGSSNGPDLLGGQQQELNNMNNPTDGEEQDQDKKHGFILGGQYTTIETYILVHNRYFYQLDLAASVILLLLALVEPPALDGYDLNPKIHAAIEMFALGIIAIELLLKFRWMGPGRFFRHGRTVTKLVVLMTMNIEAIVIFLRHSIHARYSRALRPIFLIDNHYCHGLRRAVRQIFQSLPPIFDMFTLVLFFMFVFSIFGFYLFASSNHYFADMSSTIQNLLILATTANLPDVMMPSYAVSCWSAIFFVLFVIIHLFLFTNLTMAAVYEIFTRKEKEKFHKLLLHRRKACQEAFKLLVSRRQPNRIQYRQFMGLMRYLNRKCSMFDAYLIFKALDEDKKGSISLEEFYQIYDYINLEWKLIYPQFKWHDDYEHIPRLCKRFLIVVERLCDNRIFEWVIDILIVGQAMLQFIEASYFGETSPADSVQPSANNQTLGANLQATNDDITPDKVSTHIFIFIFIFEALLRCVANGPQGYMRNKWNRFDLMVLSVSLIGLFNGLFGGQPFGWVVVLRVLRLMRLFELKRRYRDMWQTLTYILLKRFVSMTCVVMILYYFFAIVGMELLGDYDLRNCCINTTLESQFKFDNNSSTLDDGYIRYYLNDFGDLVASFLTLFSMSSNTYWLTLMSAYTIVSGSSWIRLFFGAYYLCSIVVMNIVIAFILESFLFHIHYRTKMGDNCDNTNLFTVSVTLSSFEVDFLRENLAGPRTASTGDSGPLGNNSKSNGPSCSEELDRAVAKLRRANEERWHLNYYSSSSFSSGAGSLSSKIIGDDYSEPPDETTNERTSLLREPRARREPRRARPVNKTPQTLVATARVVASANELDDRLSNKSRSSDGMTSTNTSSSITKQISSSSSSTATASAAATAQANKQQQTNKAPGQSPPANRPRRPDYYLIYQAEQIRNKFSFTMKMYAEEVGGWLAEAERNDQDAMSSMISRNQLCAEHVAMARLARSNLAEIFQHRAAAHDELHHFHQHYQHPLNPHHANDEVHHDQEGSPSGPLTLVAGGAGNPLAAEHWIRPRSYSSSAGAFKSQQTTADDLQRRKHDKGNY